MESKNAQSKAECPCGKAQQSAEEDLPEIDFPEDGGGLNNTNFRSACVTLFHPNELEREQWRVRRIFDLFDRDNDGLLKGPEWTMYCKWLRVINEPVNALLVVDVQNDFIDGSLALRQYEAKQDGADVIEPINNLIQTGYFNKIIYSLDWHPDDHISFFENLHLRKLHPDSQVTKEDAKPFSTVIFAEPYVEQILWPKHCVMDTQGAELHKDLVIVPDSIQVRKGQNPNLEGYSAFSDDNLKDSAELHTILREAGVTHVYVCGLAYDVCVKATCLDGLQLGFAVAVIDDCCRGVDTSNIDAAKKLIDENDGLIIDSKNVLPLVSGEKRSLTMSYQLVKAMTSDTSADSSK